VDSGGGISANAVGFDIHFFTGDNAGLSREITSVTSGTTVGWTDALPAAIAADARYSIGPVVVEITLPQLTGEDDKMDPFVRKVSKSVSASFSDLGGETNHSTDPNAKVVFGMKRGTTELDSTEVSIGATPDTCIGYVNQGDTRLFPFLRLRGANQDWELQGVLVKGTLCSSEAMTRQG
jgi:hypothetical protein